ncbi:MAG: hypothetical protein AB1846_13090 [Chloroflexota bacterium]
MTPRIKIWTLFLLAVMVISACAPVATPSSAPPEPPPAATDTQAAPTAPPAEPTSDPGAGQAAETATQPPFPIATSRGDALEATDPSTVVLANGGIQLVEFFRFT